MARLPISRTRATLVSASTVRSDSPVVTPASAATLLRPTASTGSARGDASSAATAKVDTAARPMTVTRSVTAIRMCRPGSTWPATTLTREVRGTVWPANPSAIVHAHTFAINSATQAIARRVRSLVGIRSAILNAWMSAKGLAILTVRISTMSPAHFRDDVAWRSAMGCRRSDVVAWPGSPSVTVSLCHGIRVRSSEPRNGSAGARAGV